MPQRFPHFRAKKTGRMRPRSTTTRRCVDDAPPAASHQHHIHCISIFYRYTYRYGYVGQSIAAMGADGVHGSCDTLEKDGKSFRREVRHELNITIIDPCSTKSNPTRPISHPWHVRGHGGWCRAFHWRRVRCVWPIRG